MNATTFAVVFLSGGAVGTYLGFKIAERRMMGEFEEAVEHEKATLARIYAAKQQYATPQAAVDALVVPEEIQEILETYTGVEKKEPTAYHKIKPSTVQKAEQEEEEKPEPVLESNIFDNPVDPGPIFVISELEYEHGETNNQKALLTYYAEDGVLAEFDDDVVNNPEDVIGDALNRFGEMSESPDYVHVRNMKIDMDYVIARESGSYWRDVHGMEPADVPPSGRQGG